MKKLINLICSPIITFRKVEMFVLVAGLFICVFVYQFERNIAFATFAWVFGALLFIRLLGVAIAEYRETRSVPLIFKKTFFWTFGLKDEMPKNERILQIGVVSSNYVLVFALSFIYQSTNDHYNWVPFLIILGLMLGFGIPLIIFRKKRENRLR